MSMLLPRQEYELALAEARRLGRSLRRDDPRYRRMLRRKDVLLTVPHGAPGNDAIAPPTALAAQEQCLARGVDAAILLSVCDRYNVVDMNRPQARATDFREAVRRSIRRERPHVLLDIHSYPDVYPVYTGRDIVLIHTPGDTDRSFLSLYATLLKLAAAKLEIPLVVEVQDQHQPVVHDIVKEARELGMPADSVALIEHNESGNAAAYGAVHAAALRALLSQRGVSRLG
jgi:hypothetical protein